MARVCLSVHRLMDIRVVSAIVNNDAANMAVRIPVGVCAFRSRGCIPRSGIAGSYGDPKV